MLLMSIRLVPQVNLSKLLSYFIKPLLTHVLIVCVIFLCRRHNLDLDGVVTERDSREAEYEPGYRQEAAIRLAQQKKVTFQQE